MPHISVLGDEICALFENEQIPCFVDATLGAAGHSSRLLEAHPELTQLIGIDQDSDAREIAAERLLPFGNRTQIVAGNFRDVGDHLDQLGIKQIDGALVDFGVSSMQLDRPEKGFSFQQEGPLDMRMDQSQPRSAADILNTASEEEIGQILHDYGELPKWRSIARQIVRERASAPFTTTKDLVERIRVGSSRGRTHPMTLVFQALRIAVNDELGAIEALLPQLTERLRPGGRLAAISFHSLEDGIVKRYFKQASVKRLPDPTHPMGYVEQTPLLRILTGKPIQPSEAEIRANRRSRSARLRAAERL